MKYIKYETEENYAVLTVSRPEALNALNTEVLKELNEVIDSVDTAAVKCLIITGEGKKAFVAGADIAEMSELDPLQGEAFGLRGNTVFRKIETLPVPVIAAVNGYALGGGNELALACDIRIASDNAVFGQPETSLGITPGFGGTQRLARLIGPGYAKQMIFSARNIKAEEAYRIGLVNAVYPQDSLMEEARKLAGTIARNAAFALRNSKTAINDGLDMDIDYAVMMEEKLFGACFNDPEQKSRMKAFTEKKKG